MNNIAIAGLVGGGIGAVKGVIDQKQAQKYDPQAGTSVGSYISNGLRDGLEFAAIAACGAGIATAIKNPKAVAEAISGSKITESKLYKAIIPGKDNFYDEVYQVINNDKKLKASLNSEAIDEAMSLAIKKNQFGVKLDDETVKKIISTRNGKTSDEAFESFNKALQENGFDEKQAEKLTNFSKKKVERIINNPIDRETVNDVNKLIAYPKTYYTNPDKKIRNTRIAATAGAVGAVAVGGRYLSGGTLTRDQYGQQDIAGIPFI